MAAEDRWAALVRKVLAQGAATYGSEGPQQAFGSTSLKTNGKIFAMLVKNRLVVKLDRRRVDALVEAGTGQRFDPGHGRRLNEWLDVSEPATDDVWLALATESESFVAGRSKPT